MEAALKAVAYCADAIAYGWRLRLDASC